MRKAFKRAIRISGPQLDSRNWYHDNDQIEYAVPSIVSDEHTDLQLLTLQAGQTIVLEPHEFHSQSCVHTVIKLKLKLVLHLFLKQRRPGDFQDHFERLLSSCDNLVVLNVSMCLSV